MLDITGAKTVADLSAKASSETSLHLKTAHLFNLAL
jgi:hypothetical protein